MKRTTMLEIVGQAAEIAVRWPIMLSIYVKANPRSKSRRMADVLDWYIEVGNAAASKKETEPEILEAEFVDVK